jgi:predicted acylesterase/phospholipase RssA
VASGGCTSQALIDQDILPDLVVGTSIRAMNSAVITADPREAPAA